MKTSILNLLDLIFIIRPVLLVPVWGFSLFGYYRARVSSIREIVSLWNSASAETYLLLLIFSLSVGAVYIFNQIADIEVDKKNGGLPLLASGIVSKRMAIFFSILMSISSILLPLFTNHKSVALLSALALITGFLYSFKPFYFSGKPVLDFISNAFGYGIIAFAAGWVCGGRTLFNMNFFISSLPYFLLMCAGSISSTLPDIDGDAVENKNTTAVMFGPKKAHLLATFFLIAAGVTAFTQSDFLALVCSVFPFPIYVGYIAKPTNLLMESTYKIGGAVCMICSGLIIPLILPAGIVVFSMTWLYFRLRHNMYYPSLMMAQNDL